MNRDDARPDDAARGLAWLLAASVLLVVLSWLLALTVTILYSGEPPRVSAVDAIASASRLLAGGHWQDPASAYPPPAREMMLDLVREVMHVDDRARYACLGEPVEHVVDEALAADGD